MKPGDLVQTSKQFGFLTLFKDADVMSEDAINLSYNQPVLVLAVVGGWTMVLVPRGDGDICFGWRTTENFRVVS